MTCLGHVLTMWDRHTFLLLNNGLGCRALDHVMPWVTDLGLGHVQVLGILFAAVLAGARRGEIRGGDRLRTAWEAIRRRGAWVAPMLVAFAISGLVSTGVKVVHRDRPWWFYTQEQAQGRFLNVHVRTVPGEYPLKTRGFPSGHTSTSFALAGVAFALRRRGLATRKAAGWMLLLASMVALSRIYLASHWPLDVLGGIALGAASAWIANAWSVWALSRRTETPVAAPVASGGAR